MNHYSGDIMVFPFLKWSNYRKNILFSFYIFNFIPYQNSTISYETHKTHVTANIVKTKILGDQFCVTQKSEKKKRKKNTMKIHHIWHFLFFNAIFQFLTYLLIFVWYSTISTIFSWIIFSLVIDLSVRLAIFLVKIFNKLHIWRESIKEIPTVPLRTV